MPGRRPFCDRIDRRSFIRVGGAAAFGWGLDVGTVLAASDPEGRQATDRSLIVVFLKGGLSTIDTLDMKPNAASEIRGEFQPIATNVPGTQICEHLPHMSRQLDKFSLVRSFSHTNSNHGHADHYMLTGYHPSPAFNAKLMPNNERPSHGAILAKEFGPRGPIPAYVCLPEMHPSCGSAYLGPGGAPLSINADPNSPGFTVRDIVPPFDLDANRLSDRRGLLTAVDRFQFAEEVKANASLQTIGSFRERAFQLMTSPAAKKAFDLHAEPDAIRDAYGRNTLGQSCLMARRLIESGVRCVTVSHVDWDTHINNFHALRTDLLPALDSAVATLFADLSDRGLLESTMVIVTGEFGRTPRINNQAGRDHWGPAFTVAMGGGGLCGGCVVGATDRHAEKPVDRPFSPEDLAATIHHQMGVNPDKEFFTPEGRPIKIVNEGKLITEILG